MRNNLVLDVGLANDLKMAFRRVGATAGEIKEMSKGDFLVGPLKVLRGQAIIVDIEIEKILRTLRTDISIPAVEKEFVVAEMVKVGNAGITYVSEKYKEWFYPQVINPRGGCNASESELLKSAYDNRIRKELGKKHEIDSAGILHLIETGALLKNQVYVFYAIDANNEVRAVGVVWRDRGWSVIVRYDAASKPWLDGRIVSHNS